MFLEYMAKCSETQDTKALEALNEVMCEGTEL
jgi:hypothetical protein